MCGNCRGFNCGCPTKESGLTHCACSGPYFKYCASCGHNPKAGSMADNPEEEEAESEN